MPEENHSQVNGEQTTSRLPFWQRFNIEVDLDTAKQRFITRMQNQMDSYIMGIGYRDVRIYETVKMAIANALGVEYRQGLDFSGYIRNDFARCLYATEAVSKALEDPECKVEITAMVLNALSLSETAIGIMWREREEEFIRSGARLLDDQLVNDNLDWLSDPRYRDVLNPFKKGLKELLEASSSPEKLTNVIRDMYEAIEKMARIALNNDRNLKANADSLVHHLRLSQYYARMLKEYADYAHHFRHAVESGTLRVPPNPKEVEAFVYTTGIFIRLTIESQV